MFSVLLVFCSFTAGVFAESLSYQDTIVYSTNGGLSPDLTSTSGFHTAGSWSDGGWLFSNSLGFAFEPVRTGQIDGLRIHLASLVGDECAVFHVATLEGDNVGTTVGTFSPIRIPNAGPALYLIRPEVPFYLNAAQQYILILSAPVLLPESTQGALLVPFASPEVYGTVHYGFREQFPDEAQPAEVWEVAHDRPLPAFVLSGLEATSIPNLASETPEPGTVFLVAGALLPFASWRIRKNRF